MLYESPKTSSIHIEPFLQNQGSTPPSAVIPLNPVCGASCTSFFSDGICTDYNPNQTGMEVWVGYFVPGYDCSGDTQPCTVKVNGNIMSCTATSSCESNNCNNQDGALIQCSGNIPNLLSCSGVDISVECTSASDSANCNT